MKHNQFIIIGLFLLMAIIACKHASPIIEPTNPIYPALCTDSKLLVPQKDSCYNINCFTGLGDCEYIGNRFNFLYPSFHPSNPNVIYFVLQDSTERLANGLFADPYIVCLDLCKNKILHKFRMKTWSVPVANSKGELVFTRPGGQIWKCNSDGSGLAQLTFKDSNYFPKWTKEGTQIIFRKSRSISQQLGSTTDYYYYFIDKNGNAVDSIYLNTIEDWTNSIFDISKNYIVAKTHNSSNVEGMGLLSLDGKVSKKLTIPDGLKLGMFSITPDENHVIWIDEGQGVYKTEIASGNTIELRQSNCKSMQYQMPSISPDGKYLILNKYERLGYLDPQYLMIHYTSDIVIMDINGNEQKKVVLP